MIIGAADSRRRLSKKEVKEVLKSEFEDRWGSEVSHDFFRVAEVVYRDAPWEPDSGGKDVLVRWLKENPPAAEALEAVAAELAASDGLLSEKVDENHRLAGELARAGERVQTLSTQLEATRTQLEQLHQQ